MALWAITQLTSCNPLTDEFSQSAHAYKWIPLTSWRQKTFYSVNKACDSAALENNRKTLLGCADWTMNSNSCGVVCPAEDADVRAVSELWLKWTIRTASWTCVLNVLATTWYSWSWWVKARCRSASPFSKCQFTVSHWNEHVKPISNHEQNNIERIPSGQNSISNISHKKFGASVCFSF